MLKLIRSSASLVCGFFLLSIASAQNYSALWGVTAQGGDKNAGCIFKADAFGNDIQSQYSFSVDVEGRKPYFSSFCLASDGMLYGLTDQGGAHDMGVLYAYDPATNTCVKKIDFLDSVTGKFPRGSLVLAITGNMYGMTYEGGINNAGVIFEFDPIDDTIYIRHHFDDTLTGKHPCGSLTTAGDGKIYGMTSEGGANNMGVLFQYDPLKDSVIVKKVFSGTANGALPYGSLLKTSKGRLYGMTLKGGAANKGVIFEYIPETNMQTIKFSFDGSRGSEPYGSLIEAPNGKLYGMTSAGGSNSGGVLLEYDTVSGTVTKKVDFKGSNGFAPDGSLVLFHSGKLYGQTFTGGTNGDGVIFEFDVNTGTYTKKADLLRSSNGTGPNSMSEAPNGKLYGTTVSGGSTDDGVIFEFDPSAGVVTKKLDFNSAPKGKYPCGSICYLNNGLFYGMTTLGGNANKGVLYEYNSGSLQYTVKAQFNGTNGSKPSGRLTIASNGNFYGMTSEGGTFNQGVLFEFNPSTGILTKKIDFEETVNGMYPYGSLTENTDGLLYGMTSQGGTNNYGVIFNYDPELDAFKKLVDLDYTISGNNPRGSLYLASDGLLSLIHI